MLNGGGKDDPLKRCPLNSDWEGYYSEFQTIIEKVDNAHKRIGQMLEHTQHLSKLDALEDIRDSLISKATGRDQIDSKIALLLFRILGAVIVTLLFVILFLLTGQKLNLLSIFHPT